MFPDKNFISTCQTCPHMKKITLEKIVKSLQDEIFEINLDPKIIDRAQKAVKAMIEIK
jgi:quinolinate synthase